MRSSQKFWSLILGNMLHSHIFDDPDVMAYHSQFVSAICGERLKRFHVGLLVLNCEEGDEGGRVGGEHHHCCHVPQPVHQTTRAGLGRYVMTCRDRDKPPYELIT